MIEIVENWFSRTVPEHLLPVCGGCGQKVHHFFSFPAARGGSEAFLCGPCLSKRGTRHPHSTSGILEHRG